MDLWPSEWRPRRPAMSHWLGWRWEFDWSSNMRAGKGGWGGVGGGFWSPVDYFGVGGATTVEGRTGWKYEEERKGIVLEDKKKKRKKFI